MTHKLFILICTTMMLHQAAHANTSPLLKNDSLDNYITKALVSWKIPGSAVFIVKDGEVILEKSYGTGNRATGRKVDIHTLFPIASVTKTFTGTMFATLEADGIINLSDHVKKWLPQFSMS